MKKAKTSIREWYESSDQQCYRLGGLAGTGKTTLIREVPDIIGVKEDEVAYCAYTGKASDVLRKKGITATTIHGLMYWPVKDEETGELIGFERVGIPDGKNIVVVDEASMVNEEIHEDLVSEDVKILYVGDHGQLPPVNSEFNLMLEEGLDYKLTKIHRQAADSGILQLAMNARQGKPYDIGVYGKDKSAFVNNEIPLSSLLNADQVLCGKNATRHTINRLFRKHLGYNDTDVQGLHAGEKIIINYNNKKFDIYNGQQFIVLKVYGTKKNRKIAVMEPHEFDKEDYKFNLSLKKYPQDLIKTFPYEFGNHYSKHKAQIDYGYCVTVHKSQGSEWDKVVVFDEKHVFREHSKRWLYTAITRAAQKLIIVKRLNITGANELP